MSNVGDIGLLSQHVISTAEQLQHQLKLVKRRLPLDTNVSNLGLSKEVSDNLYQCFQHAGKVMKTLCDIVRTAVQFISACGGKLSIDLCRAQTILCVDLDDTMLMCFLNFELNLNISSNVAPPIPTYTL